VVLKNGRIVALDTRTGEVGDEPVLDISGKVRDAGEQGLLAMALHPEDSDRFFVHYSARGDGRTVVAEYRLVDETTADSDSESVLFEISQPAGNHNGGMIMFDPQGVLLLALGDGGGANDTFGHGQNRNTLLGGLVALDVEGSAEPSLYAMGLRNPWRFWIDEGLIYIADVGQSSYEEVSVAPLGPGVNYGWPITEGLHCFRPASGCDVSGLHLPVVEVAHSDAGTCSITGGVVYRGEEIPELTGHYFYSDYCGSYLRSFRYQDGGAVDEADWTDQVGRADGGVVGFGVDGHGEMYVATTRALLRLEAVRAD
jgi:glucose/arabinose dehydrogenase